MVDYTIFLKTDNNKYEGKHHVEDAECIPRVGETINFLKEDSIKISKKVQSVDYDIEFETNNALKGLEVEIGTIKRIKVFVE